MNEKDIMAKLRHPFIINMAATYQDKDFLYMLLGVVQGGELFSLMHTPTRDGIPESQARFYAASIAEGLAFMHRRGFVYRDLKVS
jgi:serine/threonine protein kinase